MGWKDTSRRSQRWSLVCHHRTFAPSHRKMTYKKNLNSPPPPQLPSNSRPAVVFSLGLRLYERGGVQAAPSAARHTAPTTAASHQAGSGNPGRRYDDVAHAGIYFRFVSIGRKMKNPSFLPFVVIEVGGEMVVAHTMGTSRAIDKGTSTVGKRAPLSRPLPARKLPKYIRTL